MPLSILPPEPEIPKVYKTHVDPSNTYACPLFLGKAYMGSSKRCYYVWIASDIDLRIPAALTEFKLRYMRYPSPDIRFLYALYTPETNSLGLTLYWAYWNSFLRLDLRFEVPLIDMGLLQYQQYLCHLMPNFKFEIVWISLWNPIYLLSSMRDIV